MSTPQNNKIITWTWGLSCLGALAFAGGAYYLETVDHVGKLVTLWTGLHIGDNPTLTGLAAFGAIGALVGGVAGMFLDDKSEVDRVISAERRAENIKRRVDRRKEKDAALKAKKSRGEGDLTQVFGNKDVPTGWLADWKFNLFLVISGVVLLSVFLFLRK